MPKIKFEYNLEKDKWNILRVINDPPINDPDDLERPLGNLSRDFVLKVKASANLGQKAKITLDFLEHQNKSQKEFISQQLKNFSLNWEKINNEYFKRLENILKINLNFLIIFRNNFESII